MPTLAPPKGSILLLRQTLPSLVSPDLFRVKEWWYDPATRTAARYLPPDSLDGAEYSRPLTDIVDRWCDNPGVAPFREIQVTHNGAGGITLTPVDGVTTCFYSCTLGLALSAPATRQGRTDLTALVSGAQGPVLLSLTDFQTPGVPAQVLPAPAAGLGFVFIDLRPGTYTVTARETRANGCQATATITITALYGARYEVPFFDAENIACLLRISEREYVGAVEVLTPQQSPVMLDWPGAPTDHVFGQLLRGSQAQLALYLMTDEQLLPLFSGDERLHRADVLRAGAGLWRGYLLPEQYDVEFLAPPTTFNLSATDGLGTLHEMPFTGPAGESPRGDWPLLRVLQFCLDKLNLDLPVQVLLNLYPSTATAAAAAIEQILVDVAQYQDDKGKPWDCGKVLLALLTPFQARLYQWAGAWHLERLSELTTDVMTSTTYAPNGALLPPAPITLLTPIAPPSQGRPCWLNATQRQNLRPAVAGVRVTAEPGPPVNLLRDGLPKPTDAPALPVAWRRSGRAVLAVASLLYQGRDKTPLLRLVGSTANRTTPALADWVELPPTLPVPIGTISGGPNTGPQGGAIDLTFTATPYGNTPNALDAQQSALFVAVQIGGVWVAPNGMESLTTPLYQEIRFPDAKAVVYNLPYVRVRQTVTQRQTIVVRFVVPSGGASACTADVSNISVTWANQGCGRAFSVELDDPYTTPYEANTRQLVSRRDDALVLFHTDTPLVRHGGTWLDLLGRPVQGWAEPAQPGQLREVGDYLVRDRTIWQAAPAQALTGPLLGTLPTGPGALLTDASELRPGVYAQTATSYDVEATLWQVGAVQLRGLALAAAAYPLGLIYNEDLSPWLSEAGGYLTYEDASS